GARGAAAFSDRGSPLLAEALPAQRAPLRLPATRPADWTPECAGGSRRARRRGPGADPRAERRGASASRTSPGSGPCSTARCGSGRSPPWSAPRPLRAAGEERSQALSTTGPAAEAPFCTPGATVSGPRARRSTQGISPASRIVMAEDEMVELVIVVPCFNEGRRLRAEGFRPLLSHPGTRILFVDDGSRDDTREVLASVCAQLGPRALRLDLARNQGKAE